MWKCERLKPGNSVPDRPKALSVLRLNCVVLAVGCVLFSVGCRRDMQDQPKMKPYRESTFFEDHLSARPLVEGTVPRGYLKADTEFFTGKKAGTRTGPVQVPAGPRPTANASVSSQTAAAYPDDVDVFPFQITKDTL